MQTLRRIPYWGTTALLAYMPFHIFLAQWLSLATGSLGAWKIAKDVVTVALLILVVVLAVSAPTLRNDKVFRTVLLLATIYGFIHLLTYLFSKQTTLSVALLAAVYNNRLFWYFLVAFTGVFLAKSRRLPVQLTKILLLVSALVCLLGLAQWFLPKDVLTHFGYNIARGVKPNFLINEDPNFPRVMSTIRDPNSLGAFLIVPILILGSLVATVKKEKKRLFIGLLLLHLLILVLTFSRAACGGAIIAAAALLYMHNTKQPSPYSSVTGWFW